MARGKNNISLVYEVPKRVQTAVDNRPCVKCVYRNAFLQKPRIKLEKYDASKNRLGKQPESRLVIRLSDAANDPEMPITGFSRKFLTLLRGRYQLRPHGSVTTCQSRKFLKARAFIFIYRIWKLGQMGRKKILFLHHYGFRNAGHISLALLSRWKLLTQNNFLNATMSP